MNNNEVPSTTSTTENDKGLGVGLALLVVGLLTLSFTRLVGLPGWFAVVMYVIGFLFTVIGIVGVCIEGPTYIKELVRLKYKL